MTKFASYEQWRSESRFAHPTALDYGVILDGRDNYTALQGYIDAVKSDGSNTLIFPPGVYNTSETLLVEDFQGFYICGSNKSNTRIQITTPNKTCFRMNHCSFGVMERIGFSAAAASTPEYAILDLDSDGTGIKLKTQQVTFRDLSIGGARLASIGLRISSSGGGAQGDTILLSNLFINSCLFRGISIGYPNYGYNALGISIINGDIQDCQHVGIGISAGQVFINGMSFQNQNLGGFASADGVVISQLTTGGGDVATFAGSGVSGKTTMTDIRSESDVLFKGSAGPIIRYASVHCVSIYPWNPSSEYKLGRAVHGTIGPGNKGAKGRTFMCVKTGTSGETEPTWDDATRGFFQQNDLNAVNGMVCTAGSYDIKGPPGVFGLSDLVAGDFVLVFRGGTNGGPYIGEVASFARNSGGLAIATMTTPTPSATPEGAGGYTGKPITDGTCKWIDLPFNVISGVASAERLYANAGLVGSADVLRDSVFSRPDFCDSGGGNIAYAKYSVGRLENTGYMDGHYEGSSPAYIVSKHYSSAYFDNIASGLNISKRYIGQQEFNSTTNMALFSTGNQPGDTWVDSSGTVRHTPA